MLSTETRQKIIEDQKNFRPPRAVILPALWFAQQEKGWLSGETCQEIAEITGQHLADVLSVLTFYTMYNRQPVGQYHFQVCRTLSCWLVGSDDVTRQLCQKFGIQPGETSADGRYTVTEVECLGSCGSAPMFQLNDDFHENLTPEKVDEIIKSLP